ncbi:protein EFR3 [Pelomyxa schiedti]|nr:protein EFR3 [Pelomyxa schiedti]
MPGLRKKYKKLIDAVYPATPDGDFQVSNVGKLVFFAQLSRDKVPKIAKQLEKNAVLDLARRRLNFVEMTMKTLQELAKGCRDNISLFNTCIFGLIRKLYEDNSTKMKILATETFVVLVGCQDRSTSYPVEPFLNYFEQLTSWPPSAPECTEMRICGLSGISSYIHYLDLGEELDVFLSHESAGKLTGPIISCMQAPDGAKEPNTVSSVHDKATECLRDLASRLSNLTIASLLSTVLQYFDTKNVWTANPDFVTHCFKTIASAIKTEYSQIIFRTLLHHMSAASCTVVVKRRIIDCVTTLLQGDKVTPVNELVSLLLQQLLTSFRETELTALTEEQAALHAKLQQEIIQDICLSLKASKVRATQSYTHVDAIEYIIERLHEASKDYESKEAQLRLASLLCHAVKEIAQTMERVQNTRPVSHTLLSSLLPLTKKPSPELRTLAQDTINLLLCEGLYASYIAGKLDALNCLDNSSLIMHLEAINEALYYHICTKDNEPDNLRSVWTTFSIMLVRLRKRQLIHMIPLLFKIQDYPAKHKSPGDLTKGIHTVVACCILFISVLFNAKKLSKLVVKVLNERSEQKLLSPSLSIDFDKVTLYKHKKPFKSRSSQVAIPGFDKDTVVSLLCNTPELVEGTTPEELQQAMSATWSDRRTTEHHQVIKIEVKTTQEAPGTVTSVSSSVPVATPEITYTQIKTKISQQTAVVPGALPPASFEEAATACRKHVDDVKRILDSVMTMEQLCPSSLVLEPLSSKTSWLEFLETTPLNIPLLFPFT